MKKLLFILAFGAISISSFAQNRETYTFRIKVIADRPTVKYWGGEEAYKAKLKQQYIDVRKLFNGDENPNFNAYYDFQADIDNLVVYDGSSSVARNFHLENLDLSKYDMIAVYDGVRDHDDEYGGWNCGGRVMSITNGNKNGKVENHLDKRSYEAITHELGHFRGITDLYADEVVKSENNPVNGETFAPEECIMNRCYGVTRWSEYSKNCINRTKNYDINLVMPDFFWDIFAENIVVEVKNGGKAIKDATVTFYGIAGHSRKVNPEPVKVYTTDSKGMTKLDAKKLFLDPTASELPWGRWFNFLIKIEYDGKTEYRWMTDYSVQNEGLKGNDNYTIKVNL